MVLFYSRSYAAYLRSLCVHVLQCSSVFTDIQLCITLHSRCRTSAISYAPVGALHKAVVAVCDCTSLGSSGSMYTSYTMCLGSSGSFAQAFVAVRDCTSLGYSGSMYVTLCVWAPVGALHKAVVVVCDCTSLGYSGSKYTLLRMQNHTSAPGSCVCLMWTCRLPTFTTANLLHLGLAKPTHLPTPGNTSCTLSVH